jgi:putative ABC transport system substrate-binding protein
MRRREFIASLGGAAAVQSLPARAQQPTVPVIGFLSARSPDRSEHVLAAFRHGLREAGYTEGRNVTIEYRWGEGQHDRLPALAADLVRRQVTAIVAISGTPAALAAKRATATIPIVFANGGDPIVSGLVASFGRPAGNITGATFFSTALIGKRLELLHELLPAAAAIGLLSKPNNPAGEAELKDAPVAAGRLGVRLHLLAASSEGEFEAAFAAVVRERTSALVIGSDPFFGDRPRQLVALAARHAVPTIYFGREFAEAGGLMSYGTSQTETFHQAGLYAGKILHGANPADLPVMQPTKYELVVNLKTAKALGITIPQSILLRADEVIE